jgi:hypothetical protein
MTRQQTGRTIRAKLFQPRMGDEIFLGPLKIIITWVGQGKLEAYIRRRGESGTIKIYNFSDWVNHWEGSPYLHGKTA